MLTKFEFSLINTIHTISTATLMEACVVLLRVSYRMFHKQGISGQHCTGQFLSSDRLNALATTKNNVYSTQFVATRIRSRDILMPWIYLKAVEELLYPICSESSFQYNHICWQGRLQPWCGAEARAHHNNWSSEYNRMSYYVRTQQRSRKRVLQF